MIGLIKDVLRKTTLSIFMHGEVEQELKEKGCFIYRPGYNGPPITKSQVLWWQTRLPPLARIIYYIDSLDVVKGDSAPVRYVLFYINPAALWYEWKKYLKTPQANIDELADINKDANQFINASLTHRYHLQLED